MEEYPSNSHKSKEKAAASNMPEKNIEKVIKGGVKTKKKTELSKVAGMLISEDAANVKSYILLDVLIPAFKKAISDIVTNGIDMILYGETGRNKKKSTASKISYRDYYESDRRRDVGSSRNRGGFDYDELIFETRGDADVVLSEMINIIDDYKFVSVADLYDLADEPNNNYMAQRYGWCNLSSAQIVRSNGGYMLKLPKAMPFN